MRQPPDTIALSYLNALEYCPRRFYYEFVEGEMLANEFVLEGTLQHQHADEAGQKQEDGEIRISRLYLCSENLHIAGFDPYIGYLHSSAYGRPALALDLMEEFRPLIVDSVVIALLNNRMLSPDDFQQEMGAYRLKKEPRKIFLTNLEERFNEEVTHPVFAYKTKYKHCIELQARLVAKYLTGEIPAYIPFVMR
ncbi:CRISPR-associated endonuclease Cas1 [Dictyobacter arantiisoli]|uniref:CRISPR-associated endonuclease Cas1 n=1 Tax=Dictyobacter arantiisoli TaxID=2014874 RepID=A0A5A5TFL7_9CHLR|nr:CRISPR-associated endonuclease Cas1 [Dictyobacter arantiisoli]GCF10212.1 hypothetical protein KDI_37760 [Dictyobacter arantiisoli]